MLKKSFLAVLACILSVIMAFGFTACGTTPTTVSLNETELTLGVGDSKRLVATVSDDSEVEWSTTNEAVATVSGGVVRGVGAGEATITATANEVSASCTVKVENIYVELDQTALALDHKDASKNSAQLTAVVKNGDTVLEETVTWSTSDPNVATVSNGTVTAVGEGTATITAKRSGGNATAACTVTVVWAAKPAGYKLVDYYEQNKVPVNTWGYWYDPANYVAGILTADEAYCADAANSEAGMAYFAFTTTSRDEEKGDLVASNYQIVYRSAGEEGKLDTNYRYTLSLDLYSNVSGEISLNNERIDTNGTEGEVHKFDIVEGKNTITVEFNHYDDGTIYPTGVYTNIASAIFLLPGKLGETGQRVELTIDNVHWVKGEAVDPLPEAETPVTPADNLPDLSGVDAVALNLVREDAKYEITTEDGGLSYNIAYTDVVGQTYETISAQLTDTDVLNCNTFSVKIKNNGNEGVYIRFDIAGSAYNNGSNGSSRECGVSSVASKGSPYTDTTWDGTQIYVEAGDETTLYITYDPDDGKHGNPVELLVYLDTVYINGTDLSSGNVTLSEFKFATVKGQTYEKPENAEYTQSFSVSLAKEDEKAVYNIHGVLAFNGFTDDEAVAYLTHKDDESHTNGLLYGVALASLTESALETALGSLMIDLQENPYAVSGTWEGDWVQYTPALIGVEVTITRNEADGTITVVYDAKYDVTSLNAFKYTGHYAYGWKQDNGAWVEGILDLKPGAEYQSETITVGGKTYQMVVVPSDTSGAEFWGCVGLIVENAE